MKGKMGVAIITFAFVFLLLALSSLVSAGAASFTLVSPTNGGNITSFGKDRGDFFVNFTSNETLGDDPLLNVKNLTTGESMIFIMARPAYSNLSASFNVTGLLNGSFVFNITNINTTGLNQSFGNYTVKVGDDRIHILSGNATNTTDGSPEIRFQLNSTYATNLSFRIFIRNVTDNDSFYVDTGVNTTILNGTITRFNLTGSIPSGLKPGVYDFIAQVSGSDLPGRNSSLVTINILSLAAGIVGPVNGTNTTDSSPEVTVQFNTSSSNENVSIILIATTGSGRIDTNGTITNGTAKFNLSTLGNASYFIVAQLANGTDYAFNSTPLNIIIDQSGPSFTAVVLQNITSPTGTNVTGLINITSSDTVATVDTCYIKIYGSTGTTQFNASDSNFYNESGPTRRCDFNISPSMVSGVGKFTIEVYVNNSAGAVSSARNFSNFTRVDFVGSAWNLVTLTANETLGVVANYSFHITTVSWLNNSNATGQYVTFTKGTATNGNLPVSEGDAAYVYVNSSISMIRLWQNQVITKSVNLTNQTHRTFNYLNGTWFQVGHFNYSVTLGQLCTMKTGELFWVWPAANESKYYIHRCGFTLNSNVLVPDGYAVWVLVANQTANLQLVKPPGDYT